MDDEKLLNREEEEEEDCPTSNAGGSVLFCGTPRGEEKTAAVPNSCTSGNPGFQKTPCTSFQAEYQSVVDSAVGSFGE